MLYDGKKSTENRLDIYLYALLLVLTSAINVVTINFYMFHISEIGMKLRIACSSLIYRKSLRLSQLALKDISAGQIVNLLSNDVGKLENTMLLHYIIIAPIETVLVVVSIYISMGWHGMIGSGILILSMFISGELKYFKIDSFLTSTTLLSMCENIKYVQCKNQRS